MLGIGAEREYARQGQIRTPRPCTLIFAANSLGIRVLQSIFCFSRVLHAIRAVDVPYLDSTTAYYG